MTIGLDETLADLAREPNLELRLFNPWTRRRIGGRAVQMLREMERLNSRMHNKLVVVDGRAAIVGGRNIGDHYFGVAHDYNFRDLDVLAFGSLGHEAEEMFNEFWNSELVVSSENLTTEPDSERAEAGWTRLQQRTRSAEELAAFPREPKDWRADLESLESELHIGTSELIYDNVVGSEVSQSMFGNMIFLFNRAQHELLITNAYIVPYQAGIDRLREVSSRGVDVRILTNSLETHDVPAVNAHYQRWRDDFILAGATLFESRRDPEIRTEVEIPPFVGEFISLHTKAAVVDRRQVFIGSMNLDPRSAVTNVEMGVIVDSPGLAQELAEMMLRDMSGENAWRVQLDDDGDLYWTNSDETVFRQPARGVMQRIANWFFRFVPKIQS